MRGRVHARRTLKGLVADLRVKQNIKRNLKNADADAVMFKQLCLKANKGLGYKFIGDRTGKTVFIRLSCQELESMRSNSKMRRGL